MLLSTAKWSEWALLLRGATPAATEQLQRQKAALDAAALDTQLRQKHQ
jgi:hypothetical protein